MTLRLLSYNIRFGGTGRAPALGEVIEAVRPDVVLLQEATDPAVVAELASLGSFPHWGARPGHSAGFLSHRPVTHHEWHYLPQARHAFLEVVLAAERGEGARLYSLHLSAWFSRWSEYRRTREITALLAAIRAERGTFHLLAGDFNALAPGERLDPSHMPRWIRAMLMISGGDIPRTTIQTMLDAGYVDAWRHVNAAADVGAGVSFPVWDPHVRLDYVFLPAGDASRLTRCEVVREPPVVRGASDHFPLVIELTDG